MKEVQQSGMDKRNPLEAKARREGVLSHRVLTAAEAATIWALLNPTLQPSEQQELRITLKGVGSAQVRGWIVQTDTTRQASS